MATGTQPLSSIEFDTQLRTLATRAHSRYAGEGARIDRGLVLALNGHVTLCPDGTARVRSEKNLEVEYQVANGLCDCPDGARAPSGRCKHRYAVCLVKKAQQAQDQPGGTSSRLRWYATYLSTERAQLAGIATYTLQGWIFTPDGGTAIPKVPLHDLCLLGRVDITETQAARDRATWAQTWINGMISAGCQYAR